VLAVASAARAQTAPLPPSITQGSPGSGNKPQVKVNMINVCTPSSDEQQEMAAALARVPKQPLFSADFEVDRGRSTLDDKAAFLEAGAHFAVPEDASADWVRIRREFSVQALFATVQYSFSRDEKNMVETLVFHVRDPKDLLELSLEDSASSVTSPKVMLEASTPATRIRLERFGKSSLVLARCFASEHGPAPDQSAYEPLFQSASMIIGRYRGLLGAARVVPEELNRTRAEEPPKSGSSERPGGARKSQAAEK
jgi:hypothetical protein